MANIFRIVFLYLFCFSSFAQEACTSTWYASSETGNATEINLTGTLSEIFSTIKSSPFHQVYFLNGDKIVQSFIFTSFEEPSPKTIIAHFYVCDRSSTVQNCNTADTTITRTASCNCPSGQSMVNGICTKSEGCQKGLPQRGSVPFPGSVNTVCFSGCEATPIDTSNQYYCSGGTTVPTQCSVGTWEQTGASCPTGAPSASPAPPETQKCSAGTCPGTVNGVTTCLACTQNNSTTETSKSTATTSDGTKTETTTSTTCQGEACTTTTSTKTTPVTGTTTLDTKTEPSTDKKSFCEENPSFSACKNGTFTGSCGSPPVCTGDAVQCATAKATFETNCTLNPSPNSISDLGISVASGTENLTGAGLSSQANREIVNLQTSLDTSKFLASGCPSDRIISLPNGQSITLPFSRLCSVFQFMGSIVIAFSLLSASRTVGVV